MAPNRKHIPFAAAALLLVSQAALAQEQLVKIGVTGPLSGANAFAGKDNENGVRLALEELNAKKISIGGKAIKFELKSEDDQGDPKAGVVVAQKLVDAGVRFVLGPYNSGVAIPASRVYDDAGALMSTVGTNPKVTQSGYKGVFRIVASDTQLGASMAGYAAKQLKLKTIGVIDDRTAFGQGIAMEFVKQAKASGIVVAGHEFTTDKATDFAAILTKLKSKNVDAIFFGGYAPQGAPMARQMRALGLKAKLLGGDTLCSPEMAKLGGDAVGENVLCAQGGAILEKQADGPAFQARYKARFKQAPDVYAASFYDQTMFIAQAMKSANSLDPSVVATAMRASSYKGVVGNYAYDDKGNMKQSAVTVYTFKNGVPSALATY
ncbi:branched-chain amino acid ABC transporter substrate-binding protein [Massilia violaceinigra]|uniref:Branched-chain amino acid ABC transporter substrate-binding protein n=1 Tax=Massilia violaceinigra TaxID=2045208 RepID=A0ABY4AFY4_9BURK|nr:branched-chain amino acid ABC transporter substrate-binding protein [Massilia violaceinigra]UOD32564.1 branched-chain amino acid ABC transporter substrate-binding protein [Massilia violaceinigra]